MDESSVAAEYLIHEMLSKINNMPICAAEFLGDELYEEVQDYLYGSDVTVNLEEHEAEALLNHFRQNLDIDEVVEEAVAKIETAYEEYSCMRG